MQVHHYALDVRLGQRGQEALHAPLFAVKGANTAIASESGTVSLGGLLQRHRQARGASSPP